jgi:arsenical pump membrane protein
LLDQAIAYSTLALTVSLAVSRPRVGLAGLRFSPGTAAVLGVVVLFVTGILDLGDLALSARVQWRPLVALASIMVMTGLVQETGVLDRLAAAIERRARGRSAETTFSAVFVTSLLGSAVLNNDAAILLFTPLSVLLARRLYPAQPRVELAFAFAVLLAPGIAPFFTANPMNMLVAEFAGLSFNQYAAWMLPSSLLASALTFWLLRGYFRRDLEAARASVPTPGHARKHPAQFLSLVLMVVVFLSYPVVALWGGPVWAVSVAGAFLAWLLARVAQVAPTRQIVRHVSLDILLFLWGVFVVVGGLREVGVVDSLRSIYAAAPAGSLRETLLVGSLSALGSAVIDNHPMAILNLMALEGAESPRPLLAALIGGDLGPRLLPIGSLAGLLWLALLRRRDVEVPIGTFVKVGVISLVPSLVAALLALHFVGQRAF